MPLYNSWSSGVRHVPKREKVVASFKAIPSNQCCLCGTKWRLSEYCGVKHCPKTACLKKAKRVAMGEA